MQVDRGYLETGRDAALAALDAGGLLIIGPAGSGRSSLLADLAAVEERRHRRVWWCRGRPHGDPGLSGAWPTFAAGAADEPTTLVVDDAHLLDDATNLRLARLAEHRGDVGARVVVSRRPVRPRAALAALDSALVGPAGAGVVHLGPLDRSAVITWVRALGPNRMLDDDEADELGAVLLARTGGWPELIAAELAAPTNDRKGPLDDLIGTRLGLLAGPDRQIVDALAFGLPVGSAALGQATAGDAERVDAALDAAMLVGILHQEPEPVPCVAAAIRKDVPQAERVRIAAAAVSCGAPDTVIVVAGNLAASADRSSAAGEAYERAAQELQRTDPARALGFYELAIASGRSAGPLLPLRIAAAVAAGEAAMAVELAAAAPPAPADGSRTAIARALGAAWAHLGRPDLAAGCYLEAGAPALAVVAQLAAGEIEQARSQGTRAIPAADPAGLMATGELAWWSGDAEAAQRALTASARLVELAGGVETWPDSAHAVGSLLAAQSFDRDAARRLSGAAVDRNVGGAAYAPRHRLVQGWVALRAGRHDEAQAALDAMGDVALAPRDELLAASLAAALALRFGDPADLPDRHRAVMEALAGAALEPHATDVATELACLAARVGADPATALTPISRAAEGAGQPATVAVPLAWGRLLVAVVEDDASAARSAADELARWSPPDADPARAWALLSCAAATFADVLDGVIDPVRVRAVAASLTERGLVFEAARLVGSAGLRSTDPSAARALLGDLRRLRATQVRPAPAGPKAVTALSEREREVARRVLDGRTHREIGAELYISAKTVEHHVARVRQKLGVTTRAELLAAIRDELARA